MDQDVAPVVEPLPVDWDTAAIAERRRRYLSPALGTFTAYDEPVVWQRGSGQYVWDNQGRRYLDCMAQNVCISVGHCASGRACRRAGADAAAAARDDRV